MEWRKHMILAIDIGNTNIVIGCIENEATWCIERISTDHQKTALEYAVLASAKYFVRASLSSSK